LIPYDQIDTIFLDVGNTLISIDFDWVARELTARGFATTGEELRRAEAAARPGYSHTFFVAGVPAGADNFFVLLRAILASLPVTSLLPAADLDALVHELKPVLRPEGKASALWKLVMPRIPEALARLRDLGLSMVVVSNSDGTVEHSLTVAGLRPFFAAVVDSQEVGVEKPDRRIFEEALARCGARADRTLHIGDIYHADVLGARGAGIHALLLDPYDDWPITSLDDRCERLPDLWAVADRLTAERRRSPSSRG